ncbi:MAG TPA: hypothetical protein DDY49_05150 [Paenibacillaceae bacterium]|nr:hypothetical protein [Paenibacillaceae bacterium]
MLDFDILGVLIASIPLLFFVIISLIKKNKLINIFVSATFYIYLIALISITFFPIPIDKAIINDYNNIGLHYSNNFIPFESIYKILSTNTVEVSAKQILGNLILLLPFGFYLPLIFKNGCSFWKAIILGLTFSVIIELIQFLISAFINFTYRITDVDDIILNTTGCILGFLVYKLSSPLLNTLFNRSSITIANKG